MRAFVTRVVRHCFAPLVLTMVGCTRDEQPRERESGGLTIPEDHYAATPVAHPTPEPVMCQAVSANTECALAGVQEAALSDARVYAIYRGSLVELREDSGRVERARVGPGPLELQAPIAIGPSSSGGALVFDIRKMRALQYNAGAPSTEFPVFPPNHFHEMRIRNGQIYALALPPGTKRGDSVNASIMRFNRADSAWSDTVAVFPDVALSVTGDVGTLSRLPWDRRLLWDVCGDGSAVVGASNAWAFTRYKQKEPPQKVSRPGIRVRAMSAEEHDSISADWLERSPKLESFRKTLAERLAARPQNSPVLDGLMCDADGAVLIRNYPEFRSAEARLDIVTPAGSLEKSLSVPASMNLMSMSQRTLLGLRSDSVGSETLVRVRGLTP